EVGYHYETLDLCDGNFEDARELFISQLSEFRSAGVDVDTVCSHGNPLKRKRGYKVNYDLLKRYPDLLKSMNLLGESYFEVAPDGILSCSDTGARLSAFLKLKQVHLGRGTVAELIPKLNESVG